MPSYNTPYKDSFNRECIWLSINKKFLVLETQVWFLLLFKLSFLMSTMDLFKFTSVLLKSYRDNNIKS